MGIASFAKNTVILINERPHVLKRAFDDMWQVEEEKTGRIKEFKLNQLHLLYQKGELIFANSAINDPLAAEFNRARKKSSAISLMTEPTDFNEAKVRRQYLLAVMDSFATEKSMAPEIQKVWSKLGAKGKAPHWVTVLRWKKKYLLGGNDINAVVAKNYQKGNRKRRFPKEVLAIVDESVERVYLSRERKTCEATLNAAIVAVERENKLRTEDMQLPLPTRRLVQSAIDVIPMFDRHAARYGRIAATKLFRGVLKQNVLMQVLERAEIDHTKLDIFVVDDETGMPWGRPWVTICIDVFSRCILGIYIGFEPPSYMTVARCLKHAFLPKADLKTVFPEVTSEWNAHGVMSILVVDNGLEFHSESLEAICLTLGVEIQYTPRKTPWWKGTVERFIGTMNRGVAHGNPGTTFSNIFEKDDYNPAENAVITFNTLKLALNKWVADVYHQRPHRSLDNVTPADMWLSSIRPEEIKLPEDPARLDAVMGRVANRVLTHKGIEFEGLRYNSPELVALRRQLGDKLNVELRVDEGNLGHIHVIAPNHSEYFKVPCLNLEYADELTLWQHNVCKRYAAQQLNKVSDLNAWRHAKEEISEIIMRDAFNKRKKSGKSAARTARYKLGGQQNEKVSKPDIESKPEVISETFSPLKSTEPDQLVQGLVSPILRPKFVPLIESRSN